MESFGLPTFRVYDFQFLQLDSYNLFLVQKNRIELPFPFFSKWVVHVWNIEVGVVVEEIESGEKGKSFNKRERVVV